MRRNSAKLSRRHKAWLYTVTLVVYVTGAAWGWLHYVATRPDELAHSPCEPWLMRLHGAGAMALLVILGTLLPGHVRFAWHARRNRPNGIALIVFLAFLALSGYGLYYFGSERLRSWTSWSHLVVGLALPGMLILHIWSGRRSAPVKNDTPNAVAGRVPPNA
jgi:cation transport ATPase